MLLWNLKALVGLIKDSSSCIMGSDYVFGELDPHQGIKVSVSQTTLRQF